MKKPRTEQMTGYTSNAIGQCVPKSDKKVKTQIPFHSMVDSAPFVRAFDLPIMVSLHEEESQRGKREWNGTETDTESIRQMNENDTQRQMRWERQRAKVLSKHLLSSSSSLSLLFA